MIEGPSFDAIWTELESIGKGEWGRLLQEQVRENYLESSHGDLPRWMSAVEEICAAQGTENIEGRGFQVQSGVLRFQGSVDVGASKEALMKLSPWRKGPFSFGDVFVDTEWRSDWKWERLAERISPLRGRRILDVGCGNGYHLWRMLDEGARLAMGIDPSLLFGCQSMVMRHFAGVHLPLGVLPIGVEEVPSGLKCFDTVFSMGVLYHRKSPIEHLEQLLDLLSVDGELVLETLVIEGDETAVLLPQGRYAQMRNVWFLPSADLLKVMMERVGFREVEVLDITRTTVEEQRSTEWMTYNSLSEFLDPEDPTKTIEGYPGPLRVVMRGRRRG